MKNISTVAHFIDGIATRNPNEVISTFIDEINVFTVSELNERVTLLSKGLIYIGVQKETPVALLLSSTTSCLTFVIALAKIGALLIPLSKDYPLRILSAILRDEKVHTLGFLSETFGPVFKQLIPDLTENERGYLDSPAFPCLKNIVTFGSLKSRGVFTTRELMLLGSHIDDIEMETLFENVKSSDVFMKKIEWDKNKRHKFRPVTHKEIIQANSSFSSLQNYLLNCL